MDDDSRPWDDPTWAEQGDTAWAAGCRWLQSWWRNELGIGAGPFSASNPERLVCSTLPIESQWLNRNFLAPEVVSAVDARLRETGAGGLVKEDRLRRNLLSSQPLCFNLFGYLASRPASLLPWVRSLDTDAVEITEARVEYAPPAKAHFGGGSAFDAFIRYRASSGSFGFVGIECKYAEHLVASDVPKVREVYRDFTRTCGQWRDGAVERLDQRGLRQFWLNTLLGQSIASKEDANGVVIVMSCAADVAAREATEAVRAELLDSMQLRWKSYEDLLATIEEDGAATWKAMFVRRYLDFTPVTHLLTPDDPRRSS